MQAQRAAMPFAKGSHGIGKGEKQRPHKADGIVIEITHPDPAGGHRLLSRPAEGQNGTRGEGATAQTD